MGLQKLKDVVRGTRTKRLFGIPELVHEQPKKILFLFGFVSEEGEDERKSLCSYVGQRIEGENLEKDI